MKTIIISFIILFLIYSFNDIPFAEYIKNVINYYNNHQIVCIVHELSVIPMLVLFLLWINTLEYLGEGEYEEEIWTGDGFQNSNQIYYSSNKLFQIMLGITFVDICVMLIF